MSEVESCCCCVNVCDFRLNNFIMILAARKVVVAVEKAPEKKTRPLLCAPIIVPFVVD